MHSLDQQRSLQVSELSSVDNNSNNQTLFAEASNLTQCEGSVIMPATAACRPAHIGIHIDAASRSKFW